MQYMAEPSSCFKLANTVTNTAAKEPIPILQELEVQKRQSRKPFSPKEKAQELYVEYSALE